MKKPPVKKSPPRPRTRGGRWRRILLSIALAIAGYYLLCLIGLVMLRWVDPIFTTVHVQRRIESLFSKGKYSKRYDFVPMRRISPQLRHAVIAAEDLGFYSHHGVDWAEMKKVVDESIKKGEVGRGGSTISMQLVKNLFLTTHRNPLRKVAEWALVFPAEWILPKDRILELYLNVIEWGPGVFGAEAASRYHYHTSAALLDREQSARLAAIVPAPRSRRPPRMNQYSAEIQARMTMMGW